MFKSNKYLLKTKVSWSAVSKPATLGHKIFLKSALILVAMAVAAHYDLKMISVEPVKETCLGKEWSGSFVSYLLLLSMSRYLELQQQLLQPQLPSEPKN